jgi:hypothetical protein
VPTVEATIPTGQSGRYIKQLGQHATAMQARQEHRRSMHADPDAIPDQAEVQVEATNTRVVLTFQPGGRCTVTSRPGVLHVRIDATDNAGLRRIKDIITSDLERFGHRDQLTVDWHEPPR